MFPPHLPPPASSLAQHRQWQRFKLLLGLVGLAVLSGASGAAIFLGWIYPRGTDSGATITALRRANRAEGTLPEAVAREFSERMVTVYRRTETVGGVLALRPEDKIGEAVVVSSDGWVALPWVERAKPEPALWRVLGPGGAVWTPTAAAFDTEARLVYLKVNRKGETAHLPPLKAASFASDLLVGAEVYVLAEGQWQAAHLTAFRARSGAAPALDSAPREEYRLSDRFEAGALVITPAGKLAGFTVSAQGVVPVSATALVLPGVLQRGVVAYPSLGAVGWFTIEAPVVAQGKAQSGFLVTGAWSPQARLRRGDMVVELQGVAVEPKHWVEVLRGATVARVKVWRQGKEQTLELPVLQYVEPNIKF